MNGLVIKIIWRLNAYRSIQQQLFLD